MEPLRIWPTPRLIRIRRNGIEQRLHIVLKSQVVSYSSLRAGINPLLGAFPDVNVVNRSIDKLTKADFVDLIGGICLRQEVPEGTNSRMLNPEDPGLKLTRKEPHKVLGVHRVSGLAATMAGLDVVNRTIGEFFLQETNHALHASSFSVHLK